MPASHLATWTIVALATAGVVLRPFRLPEALWAVAGALLLAALGLLPFDAALAAAAKGSDVYLFLAGMMLLSEIARREGVFDWIAAYAVRAARGSGPRLFALVYGLGIAVTAILSNDATAVVLTPAVFAVTRKARVEPLPYLFACAMVANAASFVLPISNPANLVVYDGHMPALAVWLGHFLLPSVVAIGATYFALRLAESDRLSASCHDEAAPPMLAAGGKVTLAGIFATVAVLLAVSAFGLPLGLPTALLGAATVAVVLLRQREQPWGVLRHIAWSILPLVAGLFVLVEALARTGVIADLALLLAGAARHSQTMAAASAGAAIAVASNLANNLPAGLIASAALAQTHQANALVDCVLIGVDLGPNLSVTGSLATILWLVAIRREGEDVDFRRFLKVGAVVMPPALILALAARLLIG